MEYVIALNNVATLLLVTGGILGLLVFGFLLLFLAPGIVHWFRLRAIQARLQSFEGKTPPGEFKKLFANDKRLAHLWREYDGFRFSNCSMPRKTKMSALRERRATLSSRGSKCDSVIRSAFASEPTVASISTRFSISSLS